VAKPRVTLLVCTYNDEGTIDKVLAGLTALTYRPLDLLVVNDASTDRTGEIIGRHAVRRITNESNKGLGYNQNLGLGMAQGELLALVQSDCVVSDPEWLDEMVALMQDGVGAVVSQRVIDNFRDLPAGARLFNAVAPQELENGSGEPREIQYCRGKADLYRVAVLRELGGWDTSFFTAGEDTDLSIRLRQQGLKILLHPRAKVHYLFSGRQVSVAGALRKAFLYGKTAFQLYRLHGYDGIQSRTYLATLLSALVLLLPPAVQAAAGPILLVYAWTCRIQTPSVSGAGSRFRGVPLGLLAVIAAFPVTVLDLPITLRSLLQLPARSLLAAGSTYLAYLAGKNTGGNARRGESWSFAPASFLFCAGWRLISGAGYLAGVLSFLRGRISGRSKAQWKKNESTPD
jgi:GT2 family glycosyltransferase